MRLEVNGMPHLTPFSKSFSILRFSQLYRNRIVVQFQATTTRAADDGKLCSQVNYPTGDATSAETPMVPHTGRRSRTPRPRMAVPLAKPRPPRPAEGR